MLPIPAAVRDPTPPGSARSARETAPARNLDAASLYRRNLTGGKDNDKVQSRKAIKRYERSGKVAPVDRFAPRLNSVLRAVRLEMQQRRSTVPAILCRERMK